ncbi:DUF2877 domain-containing protein [uncultured Ornithinimicrobium sp.]|uniref:DUF2877 domain-containing protein n=1 Tax=uncultured Ornithinimicrobium sp. TaxID=259307 RepID=UPI00259622AD|nr:DUF2877 domain-containing protein [uncultured Ornithinimicrobium sp.]
MPTASAVAPLARPGRTVRPATASTVRPAAASTLAPAWLHGTPGPAQVVAVFDVAVYLRRGQDVLPLLAPEALALPGGLRVADGADLDVLGLTVGDKVTVGHGQVVARAGGLVVRRTWRPQRVPSADLSPDARATALAAIAGRTRIEDDLGPVLADLATGLVGDLGRTPDDGYGASHPTPNPSPVRSLVGLGPGLTPAGDDVLCGVLLGLRATGGEQARSALEREVAPLLGRTTALSATLLRHAAAGYAVPPLVALLRAWHAGADEHRLAALAVEVAAVGHTSGAALLLGLATVLAPPHTPLPIPDPAAAPAVGPPRGTS